MKSDRRIAAAAAVYAIWCAFYTVNFYLEIVPIPQHTAALVCMGAALCCTIVAGLRIAVLKYSPLILIIFFTLCGRLTAYSADFIARLNTGEALFMLPFGRFDFFVCSLLLAGMLRYMTLRAEAGRGGFRPQALLPIVLFALPTSADLLRQGLSAETVYSFVYTAFAVWVLAAAIIFRLKFPGQAAFAWAAGGAVLIDMTFYLERFGIPFRLPPELPTLLMPFGLLLALRASMLISGEDIND